jgi:hypothetical protein
MKWFMGLVDQPINLRSVDSGDFKYDSIVEQIGEFIAGLGYGNKSSQKSISECYQKCSKKNSVDESKVKPLHAEPAERLYSILGLLSHTIRSLCINKVCLNNCLNSLDPKQSSSTIDDESSTEAMGEMFATHRLL